MAFSTGASIPLGRGSGSGSASLGLTSAVRDEKYRAKYDRVSSGRRGVRFSRVSDICSAGMIEETQILARMKTIYQHKAEKLSIENIAESKGISENMLLAWLDKELDDEHACIQIPFALLLVAIFAALSVTTLGNHYVQDVQTSIETFLHENTNFGFNTHSEAVGHLGIGDIHSVPDFYSWLRLGFVPNVLTDSFIYSEWLPEQLQTGPSPPTLPTQKQYAPQYERTSPAPADLMHWSHIVGSVRLSSCATYSIALRENYMPSCVTGQDLQLLFCCYLKLQDKLRLPCFRNKYLSCEG
ncbi:unnamed protein product [Amoebophrya sp. A120]|nr:unnamed protein product [Amoebophrya sp. A120]|eukprot:GSA120T00015034001.1